MQNNKIDNTKIDNTIKLVTILFLVIGCWTTFYVEPHNSNVNWNTTEWLINYSDGFVRRGFWGSVLQNSGIPISSIIDLLCLITFFIAIGVIVLCLRIFEKLKRLNNTLKNDIYIWILNPSLIGFYFLDSVSMRKDLLFVLCILIQLNSLIRINVLKAGIEKFLPILLTAFIGIMLALSHEGLTFFLWLPFSLFLSFMHLQRVTRSSRKSFYLALSALSPALVIILISVYFHGDQHTVLSICESWKPLLTKNCTAESKLDAIGALGWNLKYVMSRSRNAILNPLWLILLIFWGMFNLLLSKKYNKLKLENKLIVYLSLLITSLPLYIIADDFGRWFTLSSITFILFNASLPFIGLEDDLNIFTEAIKSRTTFIQKNLHFGIFFNFANIFSNLPNNLFGKILFLSLGLPGCCLSMEHMAIGLPAFYMSMERIFSCSLIGFAYRFIKQGIGNG
jgi:hypothetical protein